MNQAISQRDPEFNAYGMPVWCHHHCTKMRVKEMNLPEQRLVIAGSAAEVRFSRDAHKRDRWLVQWSILHGGPEVNGKTLLTSDELAAAFGLKDETDKYSTWLIKRFGADAASQFGFIRWQEYLNIPCPGTGHDGDPNVSINIDDEMKRYVRLLLTPQ